MTKNRENASNTKKTILTIILILSVILFLGYTYFISSIFAYLDGPILFFLLLFLVYLNSNLPKDIDLWLLLMISILIVGLIISMAYVIPKGYSMYIPVGVFLSFVYLFSFYRYHPKKIWFALSILVFFFSLFFVFNLIFIQLVSHDYPLVLSSGEEFNVNYTVKCGSMAVVCKPEKDVFVEDGFFSCSVNISKYGREDSCILFQDIMPYHYVTVRVINCKFPVDNWSTDCILAYVSPPIREYKVYQTPPLMFYYSGRNVIEVSMLIEEEYNMDKGEDLEYRFLPRGIGVINTKSSLEVNQQNTTRLLAFITALFALVGIFPAIYELKKLYENS